MNDSSLTGIIKQLFNDAPSLPGEYYLFVSIDRSAYSLSVAINSNCDFCIKLPSSIVCRPLTLGRLIVSQKSLESCFSPAQATIIDGLFLSLQTKSLKEAIALISLVFSYLSTKDDLSLSDWLKRISEIFNNNKGFNAIGLAGELLFLYRSMVYCSDIIRCWNPIGYTPFDFSPPPGLSASPHYSYIEVKSTNLDADNYCLKMSQLNHQISVTESYTYAFVGVAIASDGLSLKDFCQAISVLGAQKFSHESELFQVLQSKIEMVVAWLSMAECEFRFEPNSCTICLSTEKDIPFPVNLHKAISIDIFYLKPALISSLSLPLFFKNL
jgi:hypothetical protein